MKFSERQEKYYAKLHQRARRNRKTIREALKWLDDNYTGSNTRKAIRHQMEAEEWQIVVELQLRLVYKTLLRKEKAIERSGLEMRYNGMLVCKCCANCQDTCDKNELDYCENYLFSEDKFNKVGTEKALLTQG